jgi:hypothetical protein
MAGRIAYLGNIITQGLVLDLDAGIKGSYPGTGTTWTDISNNGNNGTLTNGPTFTGSDYGAIVFDGINDQVYTTTGNAFNIAGPGNISAVVKVNSTGSKVTTSILNIVKSSNGIQVVFRDNGNTFGITKYGGAYLLQITNRANFPQQGETTYISVNFSGSNISYYKNGNLIQTTSAAVNQSGLAPYIISGYDIGDYSEAFTGNVYTTQIYNRALSQAEITQNFNALRGRYGI